MQHVNNLEDKGASSLANNDLPSDLNQYFDLVTFVFILDSSYNVRRTAASVIVEFIGIFKFDNGYSFINLIDKNYHKRLESGGKLVDLLANFYDFKQFNNGFLECKLYHYNHDIKKLAAYIIVKHSNPLFFYNFEDTDTLDKKISTLYLLIFTLEHNDSILDENFIQKVIINDKLFKTRNSEVFIRLYLHFMRLLVSFTFKKQLYPIFNIESEIIGPNLIQQNIDQILENLHFLLIKNMFPYETSTLCWILANEKFNKKLLAGLRRNNESFILVNIRQKDFPFEKYKSNLYSDNLDVRIATYKAIKYMENPLILKNEVVKGLDDYSTDRRGDISYKIRLESLYLAISLNLPAEKFIIRYLVDKSKFLRDMTCVMLREMKIMKFYDVILSKRNSIVNFEDYSEQINLEMKVFFEVRTLSHSFSENLLEFIDKFESIFEERQNEMTNKELCYFDSMLFASKNLAEDYKNEFYTGICSSIIFSDKTLSNFLIERIFDIKEHVLFAMENIEYPNLSTLKEIFYSYLNK
ncbi:tubulin-folding cofactor D [Nosema bombycis CQ1]|uniref:Tubulin-folding cofactor D n=1 Tax=Nosema bombycis (strain CQ1 / CVCC 102059) TaxID=578461 RepID=R0MLS4_NOSB1|nr:tubulin-folding cofactor D [Nosema bombycis CQ1]|eukprot:EOB15200.1 tubulin-folding cofactor D [Nosema bombycis CQ1]